MRNRQLKLILVVIGIITLIGCQTVLYTPKAALDTPARHAENGMRLLGNGLVEDAFREFNHAKALDANYAPAYVGLGFCYGLMGDTEKGLAVMEMVKKLPKPATQKSGPHN